MTYDTQGRRLLSNPLWKDYEFAEPAKGHPSTWSEEVKQLRAENERLRAALREIVRMTDNGADAPMTAERWLDRIDETALDALKATTAPHSTTPQREVGRK